VVSVRGAAAFALILGTAMFLAFLALVGDGPLASQDARHLRAMKRRTAPPTAAAPMDRARIAALPHRRPDAGTARLEERGVVVEGWVQRVMLAMDGDIHLEVAVEPDPDGGGADYVTAEITAALRREHPGWRYEPLADALRPRQGAGSWPDGPRRVRLTGWLLYDYEFDRPTHARRPGRPPPRGTVWEVHPVTRIEVFDAALGAWAEAGS
jgi:hypothetical protein